MENERSLANAVNGRQATTRDALLGAALESFSRDGYGGPSIRHLAKAVGIRERLVYKHFSPKQAVFDTLLELADLRLGKLGAQLGVSTFESSGASEN